MVRRNDLATARINRQAGAPPTYGRKVEHAIVRAVIQHTDGLKLQVDVVGLDLTALTDTRQVVDH
jgi:hypothetical protein